MSVLQIYARVLGLLRPQLPLVAVLVAANLALAVAQFAEPILFGRIIDLMTQTQASSESLTWIKLLPLVGAWAGFGLFSIGGAILVGLNADRLAHRRRLAVMSEYFNHVLSLPLTFHTNVHSGRILKTMLDGAAAMFGLWLSFFRENCASFVALSPEHPLTLELAKKDVRLAAFVEECRHVGTAAQGLSARRISIEAGHRARFWQNNCVAVGLSAGFIEPLEASALMLIETAMDAIADRLPRTRAAMDVMARQFNATFTHHWMRIIEFLKLHYVLTKRTDTDFWRDNVAASSIPDGLAERLELWRHHSPGPQDFTHAREVFSWPSYQYVLHGMGFESHRPPVDPAAPDAALAERFVARTARAKDELRARAPIHRDLLRAIREHGLQRV